MVKTPLIVSIVVTYNAKPWLHKCFGSLTNAELRNHTILAIDNSSSDETISELQNYFPDVQIIETGQNLGFGKANNIGLKWALENDADYVFLLNQDAWINTDTISKLIEISNEHNEFGIISPIHLNKTNKVDPGFAHYCLKDENSSFIFDSFCLTPTKSIYETEFINAAAWLVTKKCLLINGGFMPIFPHYGEDLNYCERVLSSDLKIGFTPGLTIIHDRDTQKRKLSIRKKYNFMYVHLLGIFTSGKKRGTYNYLKYCIKGILGTFKIYWKNIPILALIPLALIQVIFNLITIVNQRKQALKKSPNFIT